MAGVTPAARRICLRMVFIFASLIDLMNLLLRFTDRIHLLVLKAGHAPGGHHPMKNYCRPGADTGEPQPRPRINGERDGSHVIEQHGPDVC